MVVFLYGDMVPTSLKGKPPKFSVEELRKFPGNESLSDEQLEEQSNTLLEFSMIVYQLYQQQEESDDLMQLISVENQDFAEDRLAEEKQIAPVKSLRHQQS